MSFPLTRRNLSARLTPPLLGVHFEICAIVQGQELVIHKYENVQVGDKIGLSVDPYEIHLMKVDEDETV